MLYAFLHFALEVTVTSTSWSLPDREPPEDVVPHPVTVDTLPVYSAEESAGRHTGAIWREKVMEELKVKMLKS